LYPQIFGKYVLERPLAVGGMARVFLATLRGAGGFEKKLVVKQIRAELATDDAFVRRFVEEAKTTVELSHPNIVPVYELGVEQGVYYLAMELCDGVTLAELLQKTGKLTPEEGAYIGIEICRALDYAHRKARIIHRDVTPRNVVIDEEGAVRLIDFGIAAPAYDGAHEVFGSPGHMPPEQLRGEEVGPPADVFAVGALLYEAWTVRAPFRRRTAEQSQSALSEPVAALSTFDAALAALDALIASALAINPVDRPQSAEELSRPLRRFISDRDLGDLTRRVGERVRILRSARASDAGPELPESPAGVTPAASETRTFATRSPGTEPVAATRRMSDDAGTWSRAGEREARASVRLPRRRPVRGIAGLLVGVLLVAASGAAWRYRNGQAPAGENDDVAPIAGDRPTALAVAALETAERSAPLEEPRPTPSAAVSMNSPASPAPPKASGRATAASPSAAPRSTPAAAEATPAPGVDDRSLAHLRIFANPMANVEIDGKSRGPAPIADVALLPGTHLVRLDCTALGEAVAQNIPVGPGENVTISGDFTGAHGRIVVRRSATSP
jgi:eukaryotic-like serine/threonine-protein kinase